MEPTQSAMRRVLRRAEDGVTLNPDEASTLLHARGDDLTRLCAAAARVRDAGLTAAGRPGVITYSRKVFIPLTHLCRDRCHYCTFVTAPAALAKQGKGLYLSPDEVLAIARDGAALGCKEALFTLGDRPEDRWPEARAWLESHGYDSTLAYLRAMAILVLEETGLLPHLNPGVMTWEELGRLKPVAPSLGMMLETSSRRLFETPGLAHFGSPDKDPAVRLRVIEDAGRLGIPFTTGLLVGIGETLEERAESLFDLRTVARKYGHVQEVIVQNFRAKPGTAMRAATDPGHEEYVATLAVARLVLGPGMRLQAPPNLSDPDELAALLAAGVDDWGGVSPLTPDHVNPERPWPHLDDLAARTSASGFTLHERLTVHPGYALAGQPWIDPRVLPHVRALMDDATGLAVEGRIPVGAPWQEPDAEWGSTGRVDLHVEVDTVGRTGDRRGDFSDVYGDWEALREQVSAVGGTVPVGSEAAAGPVAARAGVPRLDGDVSAALAAAERAAGSGVVDLEDRHALALAHAEGADLQALCALADTLRREVVGDTVTYIVTRNVNFTNVCYTGCRFCAFAQRKTDADAYTLSLDEVGRRAEEAWAAGATEICMQGGIHPDLPGSAYLDLAREIKRRVPGIHLHAYSPMEIINGASRTDLSIRDFLVAVREAGVSSIPGTAAEILDDDVRWVLTKGKLPAAQWVEVVSTAHSVGLPSSSTMMYGHVDTPSHWVGHLRTLAAVQDRAVESGAPARFTEFVLLPFVHQNAPIYLAGLARPGPTPRDNLAAHALARVMLHGRIPNIQTSWVKLGAAGAQAMLQAGANDLGGTLMEETISRMAGSSHGSAMTPEELEAIATGIGRPVRQRTTGYGEVPAERVATSRRVRSYLPLMAHAAREAAAT